MEVSRVPVRSPSLQTVAKVVHAVQELTAGQRVVAELLEIFWPEVFSSISRHCVITWRRSDDSEGRHLPTLVPSTKHAHS